MPGDYNGDGATDIAVWRPTYGEWLINENGVAQTPVFSGLPGDVPVPGDYNGDGATDIAVWRPTYGEWLINENGVVQTPNFSGLPGDVPTPERTRLPLKRLKIES